LIKISIVIPTLNEEKFIEKTLESLNRQINFDDEIIIIDSYSTDKTVEISKKYRVKIFSIPRCGIGPAKTYGAQKAKNEVVAFLDADGVPYPNWLDRIRKQFENKKVHSTAGIDLYSSESKFNELIYNVFSILVYTTGIIYYAITKNPWLPFNNCAIRKNIFLELGGLKNIVCEDYDFAHRAKGITNVYDNKMRVVLSDRRFKKVGFLKTIWFWILSDFAILRNNNKIKSTRYKVIR
jgi:glycosyltransferase involved in cell wall biosynthesis